MEWKTLLSEKRMRGSGKKQHAKNRISAVSLKRTIIGS